MNEAIEYSLLIDGNFDNVEVYSLFNSCLSDAEAWKREYLLLDPNANVQVISRRVMRSEWTTH